MGGSSKTVTAGYKYQLGWHTVLCRGPIDALLAIRYGQRKAFDGNHNASGELYIDKPNLFGGEEREGGVQGYFDVLFGERTQTENAYLSSKISGPMPAFRGLVSVIAKKIYYSAMNPYMKDWWFRPQRNFAREFEWYEAKADINGHMNPAHICVDVITSSWGMNRSASEIDLDAFESVADVLYDEGFGLSFYWANESSCGAFLNMVMEHVAGLIFPDPETGKITIKLLRNDYDYETIPAFDNSNSTLVSFERQQLGETVNELKVVYTRDDNGEDAITTPAQNMGNIAAQGGLIQSATVNYPGIYDGDLALRCAQRDLKVLSTRLSKMEREVDRSGWDLKLGGVVKITDPNVELDGVVFRVVKKDEGDIQNPKIKLTLVQDVFGMPLGSYIQHQPTLWIDPATDPADLSDVKVLEAPYFDAATDLTLADFNNLDPDWGFAYLFGRKEGGDWTIGNLLSSSNNVDFQPVGSGSFTPYATLSAAISDYLQATLPIENITDVTEELIGEYAYIFEGADYEMVAVTGVDLINSEITVERGILDTIPMQFSLGAAIWFGQAYNLTDQTERVLSETSYYKVLPTTSRGVLAEADATSHAITMANRAQRPYPPGNVKLNGGYYPATVAAAVVTASWAHRDKTQQTASFDPWTTGDIGPELGVTYTVEWYNDDTTALLQSTTGISGTSDAYTDPGNSYNVRVEIKAVLDGLDSLRTFTHVFFYDGT